MHTANIYFTALLLATLLLVPLHTQCTELKENQWTRLDIFPDPVQYFDYGPSQVLIYAHGKNSESNVTRQKFYFSPLCELMPNSATSGWNIVSLQFEMSFDIRLYDQTLQEAVLVYLQQQTELPLKLEQIQVLPVELIALRCVNCREFGFHANTRRATSIAPGRARITLVCETAQRCNELANQIKTRPDQFSDFSLVFGFRNQLLQTKFIAVSSTQLTRSSFFGKLKLAFPSHTTAYIPSADEKWLVAQSMDMILDPYKSDFAIPANNFHVEKLRSFINNLFFRERVTSNKLSSETWEVVLWDKQYLRPDKLVKRIQDVYDKNSTDSLLKQFLESVFDKDNEKRSWSSLMEEFERHLAAKKTIRGSNKRDVALQELDNALQMKHASVFIEQSRQHVTVRDQTFMVKSDLWTEVELDPKNITVHIGMEYYPVAFILPLRTVIKTDEPSADASASVTQELAEIKKLLIETRTHADGQRTDAQFVLKEVKKVMLEMEANSTRKFGEILNTFANDKEKVIGDDVLAIPGSARCGSMQKYVEKMLMDIIKTTNKTRPINLCPGPFIETKVFRNRPVLDFQRQFLLENSCHDIRRKQGACKSGLYIIQPPLLNNGQCRRVVCDMEFEGGGWTEFQVRGDYIPVENFNRPWVDYRNGFGDFDREYWLGNELLWALTNVDKSIKYELYIEMEDWDGNTRVARYNGFRVASEAELFPVYLDVESFKGNAGNSFGYHNGSRFSTYDKDNDNSAGSHCANTAKGGWWYNACLSSNLNGQHLKGVHKSTWEGILWKDWLGSNYSLKSSRMMLRPQNFTETLKDSTRDIQKI